MIAGLAGLGSAVLLRAAQEWRPRQRSSGEKMSAHLIDREATRTWNGLCASHSSLHSVCEAYISDSDVATAAADLDAHLLRGVQLDAAFVCVEDESAAVVIALELARVLRGTHANIVACTTNEIGLSALVTSGDQSLLREHVSAFPIYSRACSPMRVLGGMHETLARAIHDQYVLQQRTLGETADTNPSLVTWDELSARLKEANRNQADHIGIKLGAIGYGLEPLDNWDADLFTFTRDEIERLAVLEHERWLDDYRDAGWRRAPGQKSVKRKTHPSLIPWSELTEDEREKDR